MTPWGYKHYGGRGLVAVRSVKERAEHAELADTALVLCTQLGVTPGQLETLRDTLAASRPVEDSVEGFEVAPPDLVATLEGLQRA